MPTNPAAVQAAWTAAKSHLSTLQTNLATVQANLATLEADCDTLYNLGAGDVVDWLRTHAAQTLLGWQPRVSGSGNQAPQVLSVWANDATHARDLSQVDQRPISSTATGQWANLS